MLAAAVISATEDAPVPAMKPTLIARACAVAVFVPSAVRDRPVPPVIEPSNSAVVPPAMRAVGIVTPIESASDAESASELAVAVFVPVAETAVANDPLIDDVEPTFAVTTAALV